MESPTLDPDTLSTIVAGTFAEAQTQTATHLPPTLTPTLTFTPPPTFTPTPFPWLDVTSTAPLVIKNQKDRIYSGLRIGNFKGYCIEIRNSENIQIIQSDIGPCWLSGIKIESSSNIVIRGNYIHGTGQSMIAYEWGSNVDGYDVRNLLVEQNRLEGGASGVYAKKSTQLVVRHNQIFDVKGPFPRGQFVQFTQAYGGGNRVFCNVGEQTSLELFSEDKINMWKSSGLPEDPIIIAYNKLRGTGRSVTSSAINIGDAGGSYIHAFKNIIVGGGNAGLIIPGGHDLAFTDNIVFSAPADWKGKYSVPAYAWDVYKSGECYSHTIANNQFLWYDGAGNLAGFLNGNDCEPIAGLETNDWAAPIDASIWNIEFPECNASDP